MFNVLTNQTKNGGDEAMKYAVEAVRKSIGLTQEELARKSGISRATICALESGERYITTTKTLEKLAEAMDTKVEALFFDDGV